MHSLFIKSLLIYMQHKKTLHLLTRKIRLKNFISSEYAKISKENSLALNNCNTGS